MARIVAKALRGSYEPRGAVASASGRFVGCADLRAKRKEWPPCRMMNSATCSPKALHTKYLFPHDSISKTWFERARALHGSFRCALSTDMGTGYMIWFFAHALHFLRTLLLFSTYEWVEKRTYFPSIFVVCVRSENHIVRILLVFLASSCRDERSYTT